MTREEVMKALSDIGTIEDAAERRSKIVSITDELTAIYDSNETLTASNDKLKADKQKLQDYNMELYLQVGGQKKSPEAEPETHSEPLKYEDLFNDKGEIK